ncbi:hypothetical protein TD95_000731 [Thielaviopsis punctulata]|uniref:MPN domain-containing protein n=1 Tax=Thielaviopsis punctulata TaxID=72032 RepID=A0A0F4ZJQ7_9PEZI|nr:hypothetical protein TD95_000731 [Thielaviopsis punctulata]
MSGSALARGGRPPSVKEITKMAEDFDFKTNLEFRYWARSTKTLYQEAMFAAKDHDFRRAYFHLYRYSILVLQLLPTHPAFKNAENKRLYRPLMKGLPEALKHMEEFKPQIDAEFTAWARLQPAAASTPSAPPSQRDMFRDVLDPHARSNVRVLDAAQNLDLAQQQQQQQHINAADIDDEAFRAHMEAVRRNLSFYSQKPAVPEKIAASAPAYAYPVVARSRPVDFIPECADEMPLAPPRPPKLGEAYEPPAAAELDTLPPAVPPRPLDSTLPRPSDYTSPAPAIPGKFALEPTLPPKISAPTPEPAEDEFVFAPGAYLESGEPLRPMFLPAGLRKAFVALARSNTERRVETCGMLCGAPQNGALYIHELLVPQQVGTADTCETVNELAIFEHLEKHSLVCYGWIHTHPTQTCFMSSRDLHTHASYQAGLSEAIAIVCAPSSEPSYGIFRLTDPAGKDHILDCRQTATFHPHAIDNIYTKCNKPVGHVMEREDLTFTVVDLR